MAKLTAEADADVPRAAGETAATLRERYDELARIEARIETLGRDRIEAAADTYRRAHRVLSQYEDDATGTGDFGSYVRFESEFSETTDVESDALAADAFEEASDAVDKRRLSPADFDHAREALEPAGEYVDLLERRDEALDAYRRARRDAKDARDALATHVDRLERVANASDVDLDAPIETLSEPIETYNDAVRDGFREYKREASARDLFDLLATAEQYPLVDLQRPPADLLEYVESHAAGEEPLPTLLEYADYSRSKLDHYVDDPGSLRTAVAVHRTWIERLDADPLTVAWPPPPADELRYRVSELVSLVSRFAAEETVAHLREIGALTRRDEYERLRRTARTRAAFDDEELALLDAGKAGDRLAAARDALELVDAVIAETDRAE